MAENYRNTDDHKVRLRAANDERQPQHEHGSQEPGYGDIYHASSLLSDGRLARGPNATVRAAAMSNAQHTHGNRAVQRALSSARGRSSPLPVQRGLWDDATSWVGDKASSAAGWVGDKASAAATEITEHPLDALATAGAYVPIPGNPLQMAKAGQGLNALFGAGHDEKGAATPSLLDQGVNWMEKGVSDTAHSLANKVSDVPILGSVAGAGADVVDFTSQVSGGAVKALGGMAGGIGTMMEHPLDTAMGLEKMAENFGPPGAWNPFRVGHGIYDVASGNRGIGDAANHWLNPIESTKQSQEFGTTMLMGQQGKDGERHGGLVEGYRESWNQGKYGEIVGRAGVDIGSLVIGAGEIGEAGKVAEVSTAVRGAGEVGEVGTAVRGAGEVSTGLRGAGDAGTGLRAAGDGADLANGAGRAVKPGPIPTERPPIPGDVPSSVPPTERPLPPTERPLKPGEAPLEGPATERTPAPQQAPATQPAPKPGESIPSGPATERAPARNAQPATPLGPDTEPMPPGPATEPAPSKRLTEPAPSKPLTEPAPASVPDHPTTPALPPEFLENPTFPKPTEAPGWGERLLQEEADLGRRLEDFEELQELRKKYGL